MAAVTSEAQVANLALGLCGQRQLIDSLNDASQEAQSAKVYFAQARDEVLAAWDWRQARKRAVLALSTETRNGWDYCYAAPADMLTPRAIWQAVDPSVAPVRFVWELNDAGDGYLILTDKEDAELVYTATFARVGLWRPRFTRAVYTQLAAYLAPMLPVKPELLPMLQQQASMALAEAKADDANAAVDEVTAPVDATPPWLAARGG